ncbi:MAG: penicillin acylase family protein [Spirochaetes bacterium]|jgi:penicillin amidase|nr:penicillin acylase family protein [Spirochaetota bacterium]
MKKNITIYRDENGIPHIEAENKADVYYGMGYMHARDRGMQMILMRILGEGRLSELLDSSDTSLQIDTFFRKMNWRGNTERYIAGIGDLEKQVLDSYVQGVNDAFNESIPGEFKLLGYRPEAWKAEHTIIIARMAGYLTLSQSQDEMERMFVEMVQNNVPVPLLEELFPGNLKGLDVGLLKKVKLQEKVVPPETLWGKAVPRMMASNNWVISGKKTASGKPILSNDPHLEVNRLPNVWYEMAADIGGRYIIGATMAGAPAFIIGRSNDLSWGVTYAFIDCIDSWIEECKNGRYRYDGKWKDFEVRKEFILRKKKTPVELTFYENDHGVLNGDPSENGYYLSSRWTAAESGLQSMKYFLKLWDARNVREGMDALGQIEAFWNWVLADRHGNIGFQMSGLVPKRRPGVSGFIPLPGWDKKNNWKGLVNYRDLPRAYNPVKGFFATANHDLNKYGKVKPINMPMGSYRADRINDILEKGDSFTPEDVFKMHYDVYSLQAELFMKIIRPLLPDTEQGRVLRDWNCEYSLDSKAAYLFEELYRGLFLEVFGKNGMGEGAVDFFGKETGLFVDFYQNFDRILLAKKSAWFGGKSRDEIYTGAIEKYLGVKPIPWGKTHGVLFKNILFDGKLPRILGFDRGPYPLPGGRATIHQGQIYRAAGRLTTFFPSFRFVTDFSKDEAHTNIAGGPSDRRFSKWYISDLKNWMKKRYKKITPKSANKMKI